MPELPEVETVRRGLAPVMLGARIDKVVLRRAGIRFPFPASFERRLTGRRIVDMSRRAKYLLFRLDSDETLIAHLGMSGSFRIEKTAVSTPGSFLHERSKDAGPRVASWFARRCNRPETAQGRLLTMRNCTFLWARCG